MLVTRLPLFPLGKKCESSCRQPSMGTGEGMFRFSVGSGAIEAFRPPGPVPSLPAAGDSAFRSWTRNQNLSNPGEDVKGFFLGEGTC